MLKSTIQTATQKTDRVKTLKDLRYKRRVAKNILFLKLTWRNWARQFAIKDYRFCTSQFDQMELNFISIQIKFWFVLKKLKIVIIQYQLFFTVKQEKIYIIYKMLCFVADFCRILEKIKKILLYVKK